MLSVDEESILQDFKKAMKLSGHSAIVEVDERLGKKMKSFLVRLENGLNEVGPEIPAHRHQDARFVIMYVAKGEAKQTVGRICFPVKDRTLIIALPRETISYAAHSEFNKGYYLSFNLNYFFQLPFPVHHLLKMRLFNKGMKPFCYLDVKWGQYVDSIFETLFDEANHRRRSRNELIALKILELILICDRMLHSASETGKYHSPLLIKYIDLINENYKEQHSTNYYAEKLKIHPNSLNATARRYLNLTAKGLLDTKLISEAQDMLCKTDLSVKEIAFELGFNSASHFFRFFRRHIGDSPLGYRQKHLNL